MSKKHSARSRNRSSEWRQKYGSKKIAKRDRDRDDESLSAWIESVQERADAEASAAAPSFEQLFLHDSVAIDDEDADAVISEMNKLLTDGIPPSTDTQHDSFDGGNLNGVDDSMSMNMDFDKEFSKYLQMPSVDDDPLLKTTPPNEVLASESFSGERMALLFRRSHDEKILRRYFECLRQACLERRLLRCRVFSAWKRVARDAMEAEGHLVRRLRRRHKILRIRRILDLWSRLSRERNVLLQRASDWCDSRTKSRVLTNWRGLVRAEAKVRAEVARKVKVADDFRCSKRKGSILAGWLAVARSQRAAGAAKAKTDNMSTAVVCETTQSKPSELEKTENQLPTCITPEKMPAVVPNKDTTAVADKENKQPNRISDKLLQPLKPQRKPLRNPSTPKMITEMNQRKQEREKRRELLRLKYEEKAAANRKDVEEERRRKEDAETRIQREFLEQKAADENRKRMAAARWKRACRLAVLHYRMSLQKRMLHRWKKIFAMRAFNDRKADLAWSDAMHEKCLQRWKVFAKDQQRKRRARMLKRQHLADDFDRRRLLAKSFAALEEHHHYTHALIVEGRRRITALVQRSVLVKWHRVTRKAKRQRMTQEKQASKHGRRLCLRRSMQAWHSGAIILREEREINMLVEAKWEQVNQWLADC